MGSGKYGNRNAGKILFMEIELFECHNCHSATVVLLSLLCHSERSEESEYI